jgi:hypothetical protein
MTRLPTVITEFHLFSKYDAERMADFVNNNYNIQLRNLILTKKILFKISNADLSTNECCVPKKVSMLASNDRHILGTTRQPISNKIKFYINFRTTLASL